MSSSYTINDCDTRMWGYYKVLDAGEKYAVKHIEVLPSQRISLQTHNHRNEHWIIVQGNAEITIGHQKLRKKANEAVYIPVHELHRIENIGDNMLIFIEVQTGDLLEEGDICRYQENYNPIEG